MRQITTTRSSLAVFTALLLAPLAAPLSWLVLPCGGLLPSAVAEQPVPGVLSAVSYPSIQAAWDANPGRMIYLPSGDLITANQFVKNSLWAIGLMPGVASHTANADGGSIIPSRK